MHDLIERHLFTWYKGYAIMINREHKFIALAPGDGKGKYMVAEADSLEEIKEKVDVVITWWAQSTL